MKIRVIKYRILINYFLSSIGYTYEVSEVYESSDEICDMRAATVKIFTTGQTKDIKEECRHLGCGAV
jgi:hypothetical protein